MVIILKPCFIFLFMSFMLNMLVSIYCSWKAISRYLLVILDDEAFIFFHFELCRWQLLITRRTVLSKLLVISGLILVYLCEVFVDLWLLNPVSRSLISSLISFLIDLISTRVSRLLWELWSIVVHRWLFVVIKVFASEISSSTSASILIPSSSWISSWIWAISTMALLPWIFRNIWILLHLHIISWKITAWIRFELVNMMLLLANALKEI